MIVIVLLFSDDSKIRQFLETAKIFYSFLLHFIFAILIQGIKKAGREPCQRITQNNHV